MTLWTVARQAPLSMGFSRQECWNGLPLPPSGALSNPGIEPSSLISSALIGGFFTTRATWEALHPFMCPLIGWPGIWVPLKSHSYSCRNICKDFSLENNVVLWPVAMYWISVIANSYISKLCFSENTIGTIFFPHNGKLTYKTDSWRLLSTVN